MWQRRKGSGTLGGRSGFRLADNFADAQYGGVGNGDAQGALAARLKKPVFEVNVLAGVTGQGGGDANVNVGRPVTNLYTLTD